MKYIYSWLERIADVNNGQFFPIYNVISYALKMWQLHPDSSQLLTVIFELVITFTSFVLVWMSLTLHELSKCIHSIFRESNRYR